MEKNAGPQSPILQEASPEVCLTTPPLLLKQPHRKSDTTVKKNSFLLSPGALQRTQSRIQMSLVSIDSNNLAIPQKFTFDMEESLKLMTINKIIKKNPSGSKKKIIATE